MHRLLHKRLRNVLLHIVSPWLLYVIVMIAYVDNFVSYDRSRFCLICPSLRQIWENITYREVPHFNSTISIPPMDQTSQLSMVHSRKLQFQGRVRKWCGLVLHPVGINGWWILSKSQIHSIENFWSCWIQSFFWGVQVSEDCSFSI